MALFGELFISDILAKPVFDPKGGTIGKVWDIVVIRGEPLPKIHSIIIRRRKQLLRIDWSAINIFNKRIISTTLYAEALNVASPGKADLMAVRDILDKQIVDINGVKVVRVNDIKLEGYGDEAVLISVDVGIRGILRRLGIEDWTEEVSRLFTSKLPYNLISWNYIQPLKPELKAITLTIPRQNVSDLHPADIAEIISQVSREEGADFIKNLDAETAAETISELAPDMQVEILNEIETERASDIIEEMPPNEAADVLNKMPTERAKEILENVEKEDADNIQELLGCEEDTAGGIMTNRFVAYPACITVKDATDRFKVDAKEIQDVNYIYVIDEGERLKGVVSLRELITASHDAAIADIMEGDPRSVTPDVDEKVVAETMLKYSLYALPVVNQDGVLIGAVTIDAILDLFLSSDKRGKRRSG
jgi:flagellar motility protein MotE (MotC chaperone)/sporulation protein YlmC with PRC-barrel domain